MNEWYALVNGLETDVPSLDEVSAARIQKSIRAALPRRRQRRWLPAVIAAAVLALTACGYAAVTGQFSQWFWNLADRDAPEADEDLLASMGTVIGQRQTVDGVTAALNGALWDGETLVLSLTLEGAGVGTDRQTDIQTEASWLCSSRAQTAAAWLKRYPDTDEAELDALLDKYFEMVKDLWRGGITCLPSQQSGACSLQIQMNYASALETPELELHLENLTFQGSTLQGPFDFTFTVERRFPEVVREGSVLLEQENGLTLHITKVTLTPLRAAVDFEVLEPVPDSQFHSGFSPVSIDGLCAGGETVRYGDSGLWATRSGDGEVSGSLMRGPFQQVVDPSEVTGVLLGDFLLDLDSFTLSPRPDA